MHFRGLKCFNYKIFIMLCFRKRNIDKNTSSIASMDHKSALEILLRYAVFISLSCHVKLVFDALFNDNMS